jgi:hypothetical protein
MSAARSRLPLVPVAWLLLIHCGHQDFEVDPNFDAGVSESTGGGGGGGTGGGGTATGGSGQCSLNREPSPNECQICLRDNCCDQFDDCNVAACVAEFECIQNCIIQRAGGHTLVSDVTFCTRYCQGTSDLSDEMDVLLNTCLQDGEPCAHACYGLPETSTGGTGGGTGGDAGGG